MVYQLNFISFYVVSNFVLYVLAIGTLYIDNVLLWKENYSIVCKLISSNAILRKTYCTYPRNYKCCLWFYVLCFTLGYFITILLAIVLFKVKWELFLWVHVVTVAYFDVSMLYAICIMMVLSTEMSLWLAEFKKVSELCRYIQCCEKHNEGLKAYQMKLYECYMNLFDAFVLFKKVFRTLFIIITADTFAHALLHVQFLFTVIRRQDFVKYINSVGILKLVTFGWVIKNLFLIVLLTFECERFYAKNKHVNDACLMLYKNIKSAHFKRIYKNIIRVNRVRFRPISIYGLFCVDASLSFKLLGLINNYILVLQQFEVQYWADQARNTTRCCNETLQGYHCIQLDKLYK